MKIYSPGDALTVTGFDHQESCLAIFDIDGTLTDSVTVHQEAFKRALHTFGFVNFNEDFGSYEHHTDHFIFKTIFETQLQRNICPADLILFEKYLSAIIIELTAISYFKEIKGASHFLKLLHNDYNVDIVFVTGSLLKPAKLKLLQSGISMAHELIIASNEIHSRSELVLNGIKRAKYIYKKQTYDRIISFGDGRWDFETAQLLNIHFIGIGNEQLLGLGVKTYFADFMNPELLALMNPMLKSHVDDFVS